MGQWLDWIDRAVAVPLSIERGLGAPESTSEIGTVMGRELIRRIVDALDRRSEEIERSEFLVGSHRTIADLYLWACLELLGGDCPASLSEYRERTGAEAELGEAVARFKAVMGGSSAGSSQVEPPGGSQEHDQPGRAKDDLLPA
jgi:glutathione S-transferase